MPTTSRSPASIAALQAALDRLGFSPNLIDGRHGERTRLALAAWRESLGRPAADNVTAAEETELLGAEPAERTHVVTETDHAGLAPVPATWSGKSQLNTLEHETVLERVAEQFHSSQSWLRERNPGVAWPNPPPGTTLTVPNTAQPRRLPKADRIEIRLSERSIRAYDAAGHVVAVFPCSIAARVEKRPQGELRVVTAADRPNYTFDPALFAGEPGSEGLDRKLLIPPGPNNPVGLAWISLNRPGYGIHGTPHPEDIGKTESHGCFRLANWNAQRLLRMVRPDTPVRVNP
ncbi:MAG: murein L,D-transpeptidase [Kiritimatiellae bacterium]|nr:murein L,D-transpeptidase [Kiritimatiellia bacterium]